MMTTTNDVPLPEPDLGSIRVGREDICLGHSVEAIRAYGDERERVALARVAELEAKLAEAEKDAQRYRWLRSQMFVRRNAAVPDRYGLDEYLLSEGIDEQDDAKFIDAAIDAAGGQGEQE